MPLEAATLASLVYADHLAQFPLSATVRRQNLETGVASHNPAQEFIRAICTGLVTAVQTLVIKDIGTGFSDFPGTALPVPFGLPAIPAAVAQFIAESQWVGVDAAAAANVLVAGPLTRLVSISLLSMTTPFPLLGTGAGQVNAAANPDLLAAARSALDTALPAAFQASGFFGAEDVPGAPINPTLAANLPPYASAFATGIASISTVVPYVGTNVPPANTTPIPAPVQNTGRIV